jgi:hypothetical protein
VIVGQHNKRSEKFSKATVAFALSLIFALASATYAFGDFVPVTVTKVLGVGRIQSAPPQVPVSSEEKFTLSTTEEFAEEATELAVPISREVAVVETPEPAPAPEPTPAPAAPTPPAQNNNTTPPTDTSGWTTTLATNYATPGDGFLGQRTASGAITTTTSMGVAHKNLPLGTQIELYCPATGRSCLATVNDRGPYDGRPDTFDFQMGVSAALGNNYGWYTVQYRIL